MWVSNLKEILNCRSHAVALTIFLKKQEYWPADIILFHILTPWSKGPYGTEQQEYIPKLVSDINSYGDKIKIAVHVGDIKGGGDLCNDSYFQYVKDDYFGIIDAPVLLTPGDNEWTDCHREGAGGYNPLERLAKLRSLFFPTINRASGGMREARLDSQALHSPYGDFVENNMWQESTALFATFHCVGSNNDRVPWSGLPEGDFTDARVASYTLRDAANVAWLEKVFQRAAYTQAEGIALFTQCGIWPAYELANDIPIYGFDFTAQTLARLSAKFNRTVWLINGDQHDFVILKPFTVDAVHPDTARYGKPDANIYRIHGEQYDAPGFTAFTLETVDLYDPEREGYDPNLIHEWFELKVRPGLGDDIFAFERHQIYKD